MSKENWSWLLHHHSMKPQVWTHGFVFVPMVTHPAKRYRLYANRVLRVSHVLSCIVMYSPRIDHALPLCTVDEAVPENYTSKLSNCKQKQRTAPTGDSILTLSDAQKLHTTIVAKFASMMKSAALPSRNLFLS